MKKNVNVSFVLIFILLLSGACEKSDFTKTEPDDKQVSISEPDVSNDKLEGWDYEIIGAEDDTYNCHGFTFLYCENGTKDNLEPYFVKENFFDNGLFTETGSLSEASKVVYWEYVSDVGDFQSIFHSGLVVPSSKGDENIQIISKMEGSYLIKHNVDNYHGNSLPYRFYKITANLEISNPNPQYGDIFTISTTAENLPGAEYLWTDYEPYLQRIVDINSDPSVAMFEVMSDEFHRISVNLSLTHQKVPFGDDDLLFEHTVTGRKSFTIGTEDPVAPPITYVGFTGSTSILLNGFGSWSATATGGTPPYSFSWWLKRSDGSIGEAYMVGTGSNLILLSVPNMKGSNKQPITYTNFDLYVKVYDSENEFKSSTVQTISAYGDVNLVPL